MNRLVSGLLMLARSGDQGLLVLEELRPDEFLEAPFTHAVHLGDPSPPLVVRGDADRLTQVVLNLLRNAVEHTQPGEVIALGATQEGKWARVHVRDEGDGIPPEQLGSVFNRFFSRKKGQKGGYGLGLNIAEALVKAHGGRIEAASKVGEGSTFAVLLPVSDGGRE